MSQISKTSQRFFVTVLLVAFVCVFACWISLGTAYASTDGAKATDTGQIANAQAAGQAVGDADMAASSDGAVEVVSKAPQANDTQSATSAADGIQVAQNEARATEVPAAAPETSPATASAGASASTATKNASAGAQKSNPAKTTTASVKARAASASKAQKTYNYKIMGSSAKSIINRMVNYYKASGCKYPTEVMKAGGASNIAQFCTILYYQAKSEGVRPEVVFVQSMYETGWLQYGNLVQANQYNFAGIGATGAGVHGATFATVAQGLLAQVQHLKAYASTKPLKTAQVDPRFNLVSRGCAKTVGALAGRWAVPGYGYGTALETMLRKITKYSAKSTVSAKAPLANGTYHIAPTHAANMRVAVQGSSSRAGANVVIWKSSGNSSQKWTLSYDAKTGYYTIRSMRSGQYLDVADGLTQDGANVIQWTRGGGLNQKWIIFRNGKGYTITSALQSFSLALDVSDGLDSNGANVALWTRHGGANQCFRITKITKSSTASLKTAVAKTSATSTSSAAAQVVANGRYFLRTKLSTRKVVEVKDASSENGANVQISSVTGANSQKWMIVFDAATGRYTLKNVKTGKYLSIAGAAAANGANLVQNSATGSVEQSWRISKYRDGSYSISSSLNTRFVMDIADGSSADGANAELWARHNGINQRFILTAATTRQRTIADGAYAFGPKHAAGKSIDVKDGSRLDGTNIIIYKSQDSNNQKWRVAFDPWSGYYTIKSAKSGKMLDVKGGKGKAGASIIQWSSTGGNNQKWGFAKNADGTWRIYSKLNKKLVLDVAKSSRANGARVIIARNDGRKSQRFTLTPTKVICEFKLYLDAGHGQNDTGTGAFASGAVGCGYQEYALNKDLVNRIAKYLNKYGIDYYKNIDGDPYWTRQADAKSKGCTAIVSIHFNAGGGSGSESYIHASSPHKRSASLQNYMHSSLVSGLGLTDRGKKSSDFSIVSGKGGGLPAVLLEVAFIDNQSDMDWYHAKGRRTNLAESLAKGIKQAYESSLFG